MMEDHMHDPVTGAVIVPEAPVPAEPEPGTSGKDVEIAKIEADTEVKLAQIHAKRDDAERDAEVMALAAEVATLRELLAGMQPPAPEPDPVPAPPPPAPVVIDNDNADPPPPPVTEKPEHEKREPKRRGMGAW